LVASKALDLRASLPTEAAEEAVEEAAEEAAEELEVVVEAVMADTAMEAVVEVAGVDLVVSLVVSSQESLVLMPLPLPLTLVLQSALMLLLLLVVPSRPVVSLAVFHHQELIWVLLHQTLVPKALLHQTPKVHHHHKTRAHRRQHQLARLRIMLLQPHKALMTTLNSHMPLKSNKTSNTIIRL
jgi:hypothetical protein